MEFLGLVNTDQYGAAVLLSGDQIVASGVERLTPDGTRSSILPLKALATCFSSVDGALAGSVRAVGLINASQVSDLERLDEPSPEPHGLFGSIREFLKVFSGDQTLRQGLLEELSSFGVKSPELLFFSEESAFARGVFASQNFAASAILNLNFTRAEKPSSLTLVSDKGRNVIWQLEEARSLQTLVRQLVQYCGFSNVRGAKTFLSLAQYGDSRFEEEMAELLKVGEDGRLSILRENFKKIPQLWPGGRRSSEAPITSREIDISFALNQVLAEMASRIWQRLRNENVHRLVLPYQRSGLMETVTEKFQQVAKDRLLLRLNRREKALITAQGLARGAMTEALDLPVWTAPVSTGVTKAVPTGESRQISV